MIIKEFYNKYHNKDCINIREWILNEIINTYGYPKEWIESGRITLINERDLDGFFICTKSNYPFLVVLVSEEYGENEKNIIEVMNKYEYLRVGLITDGTYEGTKVIRKNINSSSMEYLVDIEEYKDVNKNNIIYSYYNVINEEISKSYKYERLITEKVENILFELHSNLRDIDGLHADEALDELCKVIYCKLYDEETYEKSKYGKMQRGLYGTNEELATTVRKMYGEIIEKNKLTRNSGVFNSQIRLSSSAICKVIYTLQYYNFKYSDIDLKGRAFQLVLDPTIRAGMGQYFTPLSIIRFMVNIIKPKIHEKLLDPFCGSAHFITQSYDYIKNNMSMDNREDLLKDYLQHNVFGIEKSDRMVRIALTDSMLHGESVTQVICNDSLLDFKNYNGFNEEFFDIILTNPPFGSLLGADAMLQLGKFELNKKRKSVPLEIIGVERCIQFLRPGGRIGIIVPDGILTNKRTENFRKWLYEKAKVRAIVSLPIETFPPFGANIKTSILFLRKWNVGEKKDNSYNVFISKLDSIGYDSAGRNIDKNELDEMQFKVIEFLNNERW